MKKICLYITCITIFTCIGKPIKSSIGGRNAILEQESHESVNPYITDGLIAMWDGIWNIGLGKHDPNASVWKDLALGNDMIAVGQFNANSLIGYAYCDTDVYVDNCNASCMTIEICFTIPTNGASALFMANDTHQTVGFNAWYSADGIPYKWLRVHDGLNSTAGLLPGLGQKFNAAIVLSGTSRRLWINGANKASVAYTTSKPVVSRRLWIGGKYMTDIIHSFRIYNRALSKEEIAHNYSIDKERFGL